MEFCGFLLWASTASRRTIIGALHLWPGDIRVRAMETFAFANLFLHLSRGESFKMDLSGGCGGLGNADRVRGGWCEGLGESWMGCRVEDLIG